MYAKNDKKKLRLNDYDYSSQGCYFITVCTHQKQNLFGDGETLSIMGKIACEELKLVEKSAFREYRLKSIL